MAFSGHVALMRERLLRTVGRRLRGRRHERGVKVVNPVRVSERTVAAVGDGTGAADTQRPPHQPALPRQERTAEQMPAEGPPHAVDVHARQVEQIGPHAMGDDVQLLAPAGKVARQRKIRNIHPAKRREIAGDEQPRCHLRSL
jgi:hypothetical protein